MQPERPPTLDPKRPSTAQPERPPTLDPKRPSTAQPERPPTRARMLEAAITSLQHHGVAGMSFTEVLDASGAARGAIYHHFPGGKAQLVAEAAAANAGQVRTNLSSLPGSTPRDVVDAFLEAVRPVMAASAAGAGCAVAAVTVGAEPPLRNLAATAFDGWTDALAERLAATGVPAAEAADQAALLLALLEGAQVLCRAAGNLEPFDRAARAVRGLA